MFLDEANTTEGIGLIKEIMIDKHVYGKQQTFEQNGLEMIAACNPYRRYLIFLKVTESVLLRLHLMQKALHCISSFFFSFFPSCHFFWTDREKAF